ncbi:MAG: hypothetical protein GX804_01670 [Lentisphaerae bacterium]|nr:hypothetical protein [Lentisphaerota bacterium]
MYRVVSLLGVRTHFPCRKMRTELDYSLVCPVRPIYPVEVTRQITVVCGLPGLALSCEEVLKKYSYSFPLIDIALCVV